MNNTTIKPISIIPIDGGCLMTIKGVGTAFYNDPDQLGKHVAAYHKNPFVRPWNGVAIGITQQTPAQIQHGVAQSQKPVPPATDAKSVAQPPPSS